jgi:DNA processing protein
MADVRPWLRLMSLTWLGPTLQASIVRRFGTPEMAMHATLDQLMEITGFDYKRAKRFLTDFPTAKPICQPEQIEASGVDLITFNHEAYPPLLKEIHDPPLCLFVKGKLPTQLPTIAVVGSRRGTQLGYDVAKTFGYALTKAGFVVVSGLALGIDTYAHLGALEAEGPTVAVVAGGVDVIYPRKNSRVHERIIEEGGAIVSEYPPGTPTLPWHFPIRNRIISGLSMGVLVVEANKQSGSLITANHAGEQDRDVFAIPGNINQVGAQGTIALLQNGAALVASPDDIINYYADIMPHQIVKSAEEPAETLEAEEQRLYDILAREPKSTDDLLEMGWRPEVLFSLLLGLEMRDYIIKLPNNSYQSRLK